MTHAHRALGTGILGFRVRTGSLEVGHHGRRTSDDQEMTSISGPDTREACNKALADRNRIDLEEADKKATEAIDQNDLTMIYVGRREYYLVVAIVDGTGKQRIHGLF